MAIDPEVISLAMSNLALIQDDFPKHTGVERNKATQFQALMDDDQQTEALYMLATYCFDVSKRFAMLQHAISGICSVGTPNGEMAVLIEDHDQELNNDDPTITWHQRAMVAGQQLLQWHDLVQEPNKTYVHAAAEDQRGELLA